MASTSISEMTKNVRWGVVSENGSVKINQVQSRQRARELARVLTLKKGTRHVPVKITFSKA